MRPRREYEPCRTAVVWHWWRLAGGAKKTIDVHRERRDSIII
jgi:hypothetical protein